MLLGDMSFCETRFNKNKIDPWIIFTSIKKKKQSKQLSNNDLIGYEDVSGML